MTDDEPTEEELAMTAGQHVLVMLQALSIHVDQLKAEMQDPDTSTQRIEEIRNELRRWYDVLMEHA